MTGTKPTLEFDQKGHVTVVHRVSVGLWSRVVLESTVHGARILKQEYYDNSGNRLKPASVITARETARHRWIQMLASVGAAPKWPL